MTDTIFDLDPLFPDSSDLLDKSDDTSRDIKLTLQNEFGGALGAGFASAIVASPDELNYLQNLNANLETQLAALEPAMLQINSSIMYNGSFANIPANFQLDIKRASEFIYASSLEIDRDVVGGQSSKTLPSHNHPVDHSHPTVATDNNADHTHQAETRGGVGGGITGLRGLAIGSGVADQSEFAGDHSHTATVGTSTTPLSTTGTAGQSNYPVFFTLAWIVRVS